MRDDEQQPDDDAGARKPDDLSEERAGDEERAESQGVSRGGATGFGGSRVLAFESRRADEMARLIQRHGGQPHVSPSLREVPLEDPASAIDFAHRLITGEVSVVVFLTGVGFRQLLEVVERHVERRRYLDALSDVTTIARGPKPVAAMQEVGLRPTLRVPEPNTWRDLLATIDASLDVNHQTVALQEYGRSNASLVAGLEARGARVLPVRVYRWELPADTGPLEGNVRAIAAGQADVLLFTSAHQVHNLLEMARQLGLLGEVRRQLDEALVASIGPTTSEALRGEGLPVDLEPEHPKMGTLVAAAANACGLLLERKRRIAASLSGPASHVLDPQAPWYDSPFMRACRREPTDVTPVWLMRQAGRYMAEYREVRAKTSFLELCKDPALCSEVMCTAVRRLGVDAAIIFSDLLPILEPMGLDLEFEPGGGPVIHNPVREPADVDRVLELESVESLHFVMETVRQTRQDLPADIPLIGFAGAPFTLASYTIEGGASRDYLHTKTLMYRDPGAWRELMGRLVRAVTIYLNAQIAAGAQCVQLFDSWAGCLGPDDYRQYVLPHVQRIIADITPGVPVISFATGNPALLPLLAEGGSAVVGVDWRSRLDQAWRVVGHDKAVQGNLDPAVLLADPQTIRRRAADVLDQAARRPGHIFNLGHGVLRQTPVEHAIALVDAVHELSRR
ncbi:MAG: uroporphyrinogen decarboxylase [Pirellulaceae bacterium]|nr:uroporphyrinogen decarboxylase [Pirellulaceae bacterium]